MSISSDFRGAIPGVCLARALVVSYTATEIGENHVRRIERRSKQHTIRRFDIAVLHPTPMEVIEGTGGLLTYLANAFMAVLRRDVGTHCAATERVRSQRRNPSVHKI